MIQDIFPHKLYNQYDPSVRPAAEDRVIVLCEGKMLIASGERIDFPKVSEMRNTEKLQYLFSVDEERYFLSDPENVGSTSCEYVDFRSLRSSRVEPRYRMYAAFTARHLADWYRDTRFCGRCGHTMKHSEKERAMTCPECHYTAYPRIMPAVIVGVIKGDRLLLTKYRSGFAHNALIAGFTEIGETLEETVEREVMEEAGIRVRNIRFYKSQPWGIANDILAGFYCEVDGDDTIHMDESELRYAQWVERSEIELQPDDFSLTNEMMKRFKEGRENAVTSGL